MGYSTIYLQPFKFDRPLTTDHADVLIEFSQTEHEDESGKPGGGGKPPTNYCQWIPMDDRGGLEWDKGEKFYYGTEWLVYLIETFIKPWGYIVNGESPWYIEDYQEAGILKVVDNVVSEESSEISAIKEKYGEFELYSTGMTAEILQSFEDAVKRQLSGSEER
jgi:hypothetical protein